MHLTFIDGHRVREHSGTNLFNSNAITVYGQQQPLSLLLLALNSEHPRDEPVSSSHRATPSETSNGSGSATPQTSFPVVKENIAALRLSGERIPCTPCEASLLSKTASVRMRALARWVAGYIYGAIICSGLPPYVLHLEAFFDFILLLTRHCVVPAASSRRSEYQTGSMPYSSLPLCHRQLCSLPCGSLTVSRLRFVPPVATAQGRHCFAFCAMVESKRLFSGPLLPEQC